MEKTFQVPVWFNVHTGTADQAWHLVNDNLDALLEELRELGLGEFLVEDPQDFSDEMVDNW